MCLSLSMSCTELGRRLFRAAIAHVIQPLIAKRTTDLMAFVHLALSGIDEGARRHRSMRWSRYQRTYRCPGRIRNQERRHRLSVDLFGRQPDHSGVDDAMARHKNMSKRKRRRATTHVVSALAFVDSSKFR